jgi:hypothetical protein
MERAKNGAVSPTKVGTLVSAAFHGGSGGGEDAIVPFDSLNVDIIAKELLCELDNA